MGNQRSTKQNSLLYHHNLNQASSQWQASSTAKTASRTTSDCSKREPDNTSANGTRPLRARTRWTLNRRWVWAGTVDEEWRKSGGNGCTFYIRMEWRGEDKVFLK